MKTDEPSHLEQLKAASAECKELIRQLDIVTPPIYTDLFAKVAERYGLNETTLTRLTQEALGEEIDKLIELNQQSSRQLDTLESTSQKALQAMKENNAQKLQESIDETEKLRREIEKLKESVYKDGLTNTWNRKWLEAHFLDEEGRFLQKFVLGIVDLNYFKEINDTLGHIAGDKVLKFISGHLRAIGVPVVRYGGDEFLLLFPTSEYSFESAETRMQKSRDELIQKTLKFAGKTFKSSFSYGLAKADRGEPFTDVLEQADKALYRDKEQIKKVVGHPFK